MVKIKLILLCCISLIGCKKTGNYTCQCMSPYGQTSTYPYSGEYKSALDECEKWQAKWSANKAYAGTKCNLK